MANIWTQEELDFLSEYEGNDSPANIYSNYVSRFGSIRSYDSIQKKLKRLEYLLTDEDREDSEDGDVRDTDVFHIAPPVSQAVLVETAPEPALVRETQNQAAEYLRDLVEISVGTRYTPGPKTNSPTLCIVLSDLHFGKHKRETFNLQVAYDRLAEMPQKILDSKINLDDIDRIELILGGDINEGEDIYASQGTHLECSVIEQTKWSTKAIWNMILTLRSIFNVPIDIDGIPGNHGRMSKTANEKSNWDNVVTQNLALLNEYYDDPDINVNVNYEAFNVIEVKDRRGLLYHHGTKHMGTAAMKVKLAGWIISKDIDFLVHGHWHHWGVETYLGRPSINNGSLCGPDDLSERIGEEEAPRQAFFLIEPGEAIRTFSFIEWRN